MENKSKIKVILTDDHNIVREGLKLLLENDEEIEIVAEAANGVELLAVLERTPADLVLLDINMPIMDGYEAAQHITERYPDIKLLVLSMLNQEQFVQRMLSAGAAGYVLKNSGKNELRTAIKLVADGNHFISSDLVARLLHKPVEAETEEGNAAVKGAILSKREIEILQLISEGLTNAEIADKLFVSKRTVETHRQNIIEKTNTRNTANLIKYAMQNGFISMTS